MLPKKLAYPYDSSKNLEVYKNLGAKLQKEGNTPFFSKLENKYTEQDENDLKIKIKETFKIKN